MTDDERIHVLLGKHLLGRATDEEVRELRARRDADTAFREAMDAAERTSSHYRRSAAGEPVETSPADLPDWLRPAELARGLDGWYRRWLLTTLGATVPVMTLLVAGVSRIAPHDDPSRIARIVYLCGGLTVAAAAAAAWSARERLGARIASGGPDWERAVAEVRDQERRYLSPRATVAMSVGAGTTAIAVATSIALPGSAGGIGLLAAAVCLALTLRIAKRRILLRGLSGTRRILP